MTVKSFGRDHIGRTIRTNSVRKGLVGGSGFWMMVFGARFLAKRFNTVSKRGEKPVRFSEALTLGETLVIRHVEPGHDET